MVRHLVFGAAVLATTAFSTASASAATKPYSPLDEYLLQSSIQGDRFEIAGGKIAQANGASPAVKALGARLVTDHTKSLKDAITVAKRLKIFVPKTPTPSQEWELTVVDALSGSPFDVAYTLLEVQDHKQDIEDAKTELKHGANAAILKLARTDLPILRKHLKLSEQAETS
jgi:putative membrane protein